MEKLKFDHFSAVIPAYNEAPRFPHVLKEVLKIKELTELIFVDDGSTDDTKEKVGPFLTNKKFVYLSHKINKGKGAAMKTGLKKAKNEVILFLDADLTNITSSKIKKIVLPVLTDEVDFSRGSFRRKRGRVTEYAVKPMMSILFPEIYFEQPITGQICAKKDFLNRLDFENQYGVDIGILFDAINAGQRIVEVDIGELDHKANSEENITEMSRQVLETMIKKAGLIQHKYKIVVFTLDNTLIEKDAHLTIFHKLKMEKEYLDLKDAYQKGRTSFTSYVKTIAKFFKGVSSEEIDVFAKNVSFAKYAEEVISALKRRKYRVAIISTSLSPIVIPLAKRFGVETLDCVYVDKDAQNRYTGKISKSSTERWLSDDREKSFKKAFLGILRKEHLKPSEAIMVANTSRAIPLIEIAGLGIAFKPSDKELKDKAEKSIHVLAELLALVE